MPAAYPKAWSSAFITVLPRVNQALAAMLAKYPARSHNMPDTMLAGTCMESLSGLKQTLSNLQPGVSGGGLGVSVTIIFAQLPSSGTRGRRCPTSSYSSIPLKARHFALQS